MAVHIDALAGFAQKCHNSCSITEMVFSVWVKELRGLGSVRGPWQQSLFKFRDEQVKMGVFSSFIVLCNSEMENFFSACECVGVWICGHVSMYV